MTLVRCLAAIMVADVVGYSKLVGSDETGTLARLQTLRTDVIEPAIAKHAGRLFKAVGDGFLVEFQRRAGQPSRSYSVPGSALRRHRVVLSVKVTTGTAAVSINRGKLPLARISSLPTRLTTLRSTAKNTSQA